MAKLRNVFWPEGGLGLWTSIYLLIGIVLFALAKMFLGEVGIRENIVETIIFSLTPALITVVWVYLWGFFIRGPAEFFHEQREILDGLAVSKLNIFVGPSPSSSIINESGEFVPRVRLTVISREKRKITEFHAVRTELLERIATHAPDIRGKTFMSGDKTAYFGWEMGEKFADLIPGETIQLLLAEFNPSAKLPAFGYEKLISPSFRHKAIYEIHVHFKGKLEGENDFRDFRYGDELYCDPSWPLLEFAEDSISVPDELKSKILQIRKRDETQND